jgi:hypothetical protein
MRLSALVAGSHRHLLAGGFLVLISVRGSVDVRAILRLESLRQKKNPMILSRIERETFQLVSKGTIIFSHSV